MLHVALFIVPLLAAIATPCFDKVLLKDGRTIEGTLIPSDDPGYVRLKLDSVEVPIRNELVEKTFIESLEGYVPKNKQEEDYLKKGWVIFEGRWMSKGNREGELKKRAAADKAAIDEAKRLQDWRNAITEETRHFVMKSNCTQAVRKEYADRLEAYYTYFTDDWGITLSPGEMKGKMQFFLYRDYTDFLRVTGMRYGVYGFFSFLTKELQLFHKQDDPQITRGVLFHEGNHLLTYLIDTQFRYPIWINEGMAEYYGTTQIDEKGKFHVGGLQFERIVSLRTDKAADKVLELRDVLTTEQPSFTARHYAVAWSFVHFMMQSPKYGKQFRGFFANLPKNQDIHIENKTYSNVKGSLKEASLDDVAAALEKRFGKSIEDLEREWREYTEQAYGELSPEAWYLAARLALSNPEEDGSHVETAFDCYEKAVALGIGNSDCYRDYAEMLRKGGVQEGSGTWLPREPDPARAWVMVEKAIDLDPIDPYNYTEAGGILILDGPLQDLDRAVKMVDTAVELAGGRAWGGIKDQRDELMALIEPAREARRERAEREAELAASDQRNWFVAFYFVLGQEQPPNLENLKTAELRELVRAGKVKALDSVFQAYHANDAVTGEPIPSDLAWDNGWVLLKDVPEFAEDLAAAGAPAPVPGAAPASAPAAAPGASTDSEHGPAPGASPASTPGAFGAASP